MYKPTDNNRQECGHAKSRSDTLWQAVLRLQILQDLIHSTYVLDFSSTFVISLFTNSTLNIWNKYLNNQQYNTQSKLNFYLPFTKYTFRNKYSHHQADHENRNKKKLFTVALEF
jgi:hypothetical protein